MLHRMSCVAVVAWAVMLPARADTVVVTADRLLDVHSGRWIERPQLAIVDGRIGAIGRQGEPVAGPARQVNLPGVTLLPGLIDMHVHLTNDPRYGGWRGLGFTDNFWTVVGVANAKKTLEAGFTTVRSLGARNFNDVALKQAIRAVVRKLRQYGAEVTKFCATGGVFSRGTTVVGQQYGLDEMQALVEAAHRLGLKVAAHAHGASGIKDAIRAGVDTIEHASLADEEALADLKLLQAPAFVMKGGEVVKAPR